MKDKLVTVIVPVHNTEKYIQKCMESLLCQTHSNIEIILVEDGSTDSSYALCSEYAAKDARVTCIHLENGGVSAARNYALDMAKGQYVMFVDSDDYVEPDYVQTLLEAMCLSKAELAVCNYWWTYSDREEVQMKDYKSGRYPVKEYYRDVLGRSMFHGFLWNRIFKRDIIEENNIRMDTKVAVAEDLKFVCEYAQFIDEYVYVDRALYHYLQRQGSVMNSVKLTSKYIASMEAYDDLIVLYDKQAPEYTYLMKYEYIKRAADIIYRAKVTGCKDERLKEYSLRMKEYYSQIKVQYSGLGRVALLGMSKAPVMYGRVRQLYRRIKKKG